MKYSEEFTSDIILKPKRDILKLCGKSKPSITRREAHFLPTKIFNPFYEKSVPSIGDPLKETDIIEKSEKLGFLSSEVRFSRSKSVSPGPACYPVFVFCREFNPRCPNGYGSMSSMAERFEDPCKLPPFPGPADYSIHPNAIRKSRSFNWVSSPIFPVLYGVEPDCYSDTPAPNLYNVSNQPLTHCCNWRTYRSVFAPRLFKKCPCGPLEVGPADYNVNDSLARPSVIQPVMASFQSNVPSLYGLIKLANTSKIPGPGWYNPDFIKCQPAKIRRVPNTLLRYAKQIPSLPRHSPGPGSYDLVKDKKPCTDAPMAAFAKPLGKELSRKAPEVYPGPADYFPKPLRKCR